MHLKRKKMQVLEKVKSGWKKTGVVIAVSMMAVPAFAQAVTPTPIDFSPIINKIDTATITSGILSVAGTMALISATVVAVNVIRKMINRGA